VVRLEVSPELRFLLPTRWRAGTVEVSGDPGATLGHLVQSVGVPLTEVGALHVDLLEPGTRRTQRDFVRCRSCGRVYWHGVHAARLDQLVHQHLPGPLTEHPPALPGRL
jgi:hypothetical protein